MALSLMANLVLVSYLFKLERRHVFSSFPMTRISQRLGQHKMYLAVFFSMTTCRECTRLIKPFQAFGEAYPIIGIVPDNEIKDREQLQAMAELPLELFGASRFRRYLPRYSPTIYGLKEDGQILFVLPIYKLDEDLVCRFVDRFVENALPLIGE